MALLNEFLSRTKISAMRKRIDSVYLNILSHSVLIELCYEVI